MGEQACRGAILNRDPRKVSGKTWHLNKDLKEVREQVLWIPGKSIPDKGKSKCKGIETGVHLDYYKKALDASVAEEEWEIEEWGFRETRAATSKAFGVIIKNHERVLEGDMILLIFLTRPLKALWKIMGHGKESRMTTRLSYSDLAEGHWQCGSYH